MTTEKTLQEKLDLCIVSRKKLRARGDRWRDIALRLREMQAKHFDWGPEVERWRSMAERYFLPGDVDLVLGIIRYESTSKRCPLGGDPHAICGIEWVGAEPPGYDPDDPTTRASGLFQMVPAYWPDRARKAGFEGADIFDVEAQFATAAWMAYVNWGHAGGPFWRQHWGGAHVNVMGSYEKACRDLGREP